MVITSFWGPITALGIMGALQIPLNIFTSIFATILVGITGDNAIQFLLHSPSPSLKNGLAQKGKSALAMALLVGLCSLCLTTFTLQPLKKLGLLFFMGFGLSFFGDYFLLKGWLRSSATTQPIPKA